MGQYLRHYPTGWAGVRGDYRELVWEKRTGPVRQSDLVQRGQASVALEAFGVWVLGVLARKEAQAQEKASEPEVLKAQAAAARSAKSAKAIRLLQSRCLDSFEPTFPCADSCWVSFEA